MTTTQIDDLTLARINKQKADQALADLETKSAMDARRQAAETMYSTIRTNCEAQREQVAGFDKKVSECYAALKAACVQRHARGISGFDAEGQRGTDVAAQALIQMLLAKLRAKDILAQVELRLAEAERMHEAMAATTTSAA
jgi:hypothetical protein